MANTTGGRYHAPPPPPPQMSQPRYPGYPSQGNYYQHAQQHPHQPMNAYYTPTPAEYIMTSVNTLQPPPPPPPPPPPGEPQTPTANTTTPMSQPQVGIHPQSGHYRAPSITPSTRIGSFAPLQPPPLPPMFPWMNPALAETMNIQSSQYGKSFKEEASNLPFVPILVNDADLVKMTENVIKEAEDFKSHQLTYYKEVLNQDLPQQLKEMFQPLYCKLCTLTLSSPIVAKDHYSGKRHKKGIEAWLVKNPQFVKQHKAKKTPAPPPLLQNNPRGMINGFITKLTSKPATATNPSVPPAANSPNLNQQSQPFVDRKRPATPLSSNNVLQNTDRKSQTLTSATNSRQSNPNGALPSNNQQITQIPRNGVPDPDSSQAKKPKWEGPPVVNDFTSSKGVCQICNVALTSAIQADQHFKGKLHASKLAALQEKGGPAGGGAVEGASIPQPQGSSLSQRLQSMAGLAAGSGQGPPPPLIQLFNANPNPVRQAGPRGGNGGPPRFNNNFNNNNRGKNFNHNNGRFINNRNGGPRFK